MKMKRVLALLTAAVMIAGMCLVFRNNISADEGMNPRWEGNAATWDPVEGATGYELSLYWRTWQTVFRETVTDCSFDFTEYLHAGFNYVFAVRWVKGEEFGEFESSDAIEIPGEPLPISVYYEPESNYVFWDPVEGAEYYDLWICDGERVQIQLIHQIPADTTQFNASEIVFDNGNGSYTANVAAYKDGWGNEFAYGTTAEVVELSITPDDYPTIQTPDFELELAPGETYTSASIRVQLGNKYIHDARSYMKFELEGDDAACFVVNEFGPYNYAELHGVYDHTVGTAENIAPGEYHATLKLFYDPTSTGKFWIETDTCPLTLIVKSSENQVELIDTVKCTFALPEAGAKLENAVSLDPDKYSVSTIWLDTGATDEPLPEDYVFEAGKKYALRITYYANEGYEFAADAQFFAGELTATDFFLRPEGEFNVAGAIWWLSIDAPATEEPAVTDAPGATDDPLAIDDSEATTAPAEADPPKTTSAGEPDTANNSGSNNNSIDNKTDRSGNKLGLGILIGVLITLGVIGAAAAIFATLKKRGKK